MSGSRSIVQAWLALLALLALTIAATFLLLGGALPLASYGIATAKGLIIAWQFMEMKRRDNLQRLVLSAGFVWLALLFVLSLADSATRQP